MKVENLLVFLIIGALAGWLAAQVVVGGGLGLIGDMVVGILGSALAGYMLPRLNVKLGSGIAAAIINGAIGGIVVLLILSLIHRV